MVIAVNPEPSVQNSEAPPSILKVGIPKEVYPGECRVAATPATVKILQKQGFEVYLETGAGLKADFPDDRYREVGCHIVEQPKQLWDTTDIILKVRAPQEHPELNQHEADLVHAGQTLISFIWPAQNPALIEQLAARQATVLAMDSVPRITRAQKMDALSSMANLAGYRAVIEAAHQFGRLFTGQITAAGKVPPAKVLVIGAGVAGLAAVGAAKGLGAIVRAFDTRPVVKEQVQSMGAEFLELDFEEDGAGTGGYAKEMSPAFIAAEMALFAAQAQEVDVIITTALIPGKKAPTLVTRDMVESMREGSVIVDMAAEQGGNCEVTRPGEIIRHQGVTVIGLMDLPSRMASQASQLYGTNLCHLLSDMGGAANYTINYDDEVVRGALIAHEGLVTWPAPKPAAPPSAATPSAAAPTVVTAAVPPKSRAQNWLWIVLAGLALVGIGLGAPESFLAHFTVFVLACFVGWQVIWNVTPALHTPLMSVTNAISGIIILGGMLQISSPLTSPTTILGAIAILVGTINIAGGFLVTHRMLSMFRK
jgi:H+-translocating NAD(P) transhydrogenase subunit alpha